MLGQPKDPMPRNMAPQDSRGQSRAVNFLEERSLAKQPHLQRLALTAVENEVVELLPAPIPCRVVKPPATVHILQTEDVEFRNVLIGCAIPQKRYREDDEAVGLEQPSEVLERDRDRLGNMLEDIARDTTPVPV
jgi:hypothetical protein